MALAELARCPVSCIPNAGLPDSDGNYLETPDGGTVMIDGEEVGRVLRTRDGVKPLFVSPGHRTDSPLSCLCIALWFGV